MFRFCMPVELSATTNWPPLAFAVVLLTASGNAGADDLCSQIETLIDHAGAQFTAILQEPSNTAGQQEVTLKLADADDCQVSQRSRRGWYHCAWEFPQRAPAAAARFEGFVDEMTDCLGERARLYEDQSVNHPDSYSLRGFELPQAEVSVSVKDKSALGKTFVFIRVRGKN